MKRLMILGASELQLPAILEAKRMGLYTIVADYDAKAIGCSEANKFFEVSTLDFSGLEAIIKEEEVDGIMTICSDRPMQIIARLGEKYHFNTISYETAVKATNKAKMREGLHLAGVPIPKYFVCKDKESYNKNYTSLSYPFIAKPSDNSGSRGIFLVNDSSQLELAYEHSVKHANDGIILIEEYLVGPEVSVEIFVENDKVEVIQITDKLTSGAPFFVELGHSQPSSLDAQEQISKVAIAAVKALNIDKGPAHVEIKLTADGPKIIELGARLGGDHITTDLVPLSTGVNMVKMTIESALGIQISEFYKKESYSKIIYFVKDGERYIDVFKNNKIASMVSYAITNRAGNSTIESSNDRAGYFILANKNQQCLENDLKFICENVQMNK